MPTYAYDNPALHIIFAKRKHLNQHLSECVSRICSGLLNWLTCCTCSRYTILSDGMILKIFAHRGESYDSQRLFTSGIGQAEYLVHLDKGKDTFIDKKAWNELRKYLKSNWIFKFKKGLILNHFIKVEYHNTERYSLPFFVVDTDAYSITFLKQHGERVLGDGHLEININVTSF